MKIITAFLVAAAAVVVGADVKFCPNHCECTAEDNSGINAVCTRLDPEEQRFVDPVQHLTIVRATNKSFTLPDNIFASMGLQRLESMKIVNCSMDDISSKAFHNLPSLFDVNFADNRLFLIHPDTFLNNTNLHRLKLSGNPLQLTQVLQSPHESLLRSSSITDLDLSSCQFSQILPKTFSQLKNLIFISLASNLLKSIPNDVFDGLDDLEELDLSNNVITKIDKNTFKKNKVISVLKLHGNHIEALNGINARSMEELDVSNCKLHILMKESIDGMPELISLNFSNNLIDVISADTFNELTELKTLDLSYNRLVGPLSRDLFVKNDDLETLVLSGNTELGSLVDEPGFLGRHMPMAKLELANCGLSSISASQLTGMGNLNVLNLSGNAIRCLDDSTFATLAQLNELDLSNNRLITLGTRLFAANGALIRLNVNGNPLLHLSLATFAPLVNLKSLYAGDCQIEHLWLGRHRDGAPILISGGGGSDGDAKPLLPNLVVFDLSNNRLRNLRVDDFTSMQHLKALGLGGNPLTCTNNTALLIDFLVHQDITPHRNQVLPTAALHWRTLERHLCSLSSNVEADVGVFVDDDNDDDTPNFGNSERAAGPPPPPPPHRVIELPAAPALQGARNTYTSVDEIVVETNDATSIMWPMVLAVSVLLVALYFIIYLVGEITHRRRAVPAAYARAAALGGHVRTRGGASGSPLYYKLYEECSIPAAPPAKEKKSYILDFSPIHTILKKNTYKVMRGSGGGGGNGEANL